MSITIQWLLLDLITGLWITGFTLLLLIGLPHKILFQGESLNWADRAIECLAKSALLLITGGLLLAKFSLLNWLTIVLWYVAGLFGFRLLHDRQKALEQAHLLYCYSLCFIFDVLDQQISGRSVYKALRSRLLLWQQHFWQQRVSGKGVRSEFFSVLVGLSIIFSFTLLLRYEYPLTQLRFGNPDSYSVLLTTRQILAGDGLKTQPPVFAALAAVLTLLSAVEPMQVVRFLPPLLGVVLVAIVGYSLYALMRNGAAAMVAMFSLGAYWFTYAGTIPDQWPDGILQYLGTLTAQLNGSLMRQWAGSEFELGALFLLLALIQMDRRLHQKRRSAWIGVGCCSAIVGLTAPQLLVLALIGSLGLVISRSWALGLVALAWLSLGLLAPLFSQSQLQPFLITLPVALGLLCGCIFALLSYLPQLFLGRPIPAIGLILVFAVSVNFLLPLSPDITSLEYEIAARETLALNARFPAKQWMLVAPIEQLSESYGDAWYGDLAEFVDQYGDRVQQADFQFPFSVPDLFVFVEKRPFQTFKTEPVAVSGESAFDPVFRNYRTLAGRSSLQFNAMQLCEIYRQNHPDSSIEYEDQVLKVYHFHLPEQLSADRFKA